MRFAVTRSTRLGLVLWGTVLLGVAVTIGCTPRPTTHTVTIDGTSFSPAELTVKAGDSVVWVNHDPFPHTATSVTGAFDSKSIPPNGSWKYEAATKGNFSYICAFHPTMRGVLRVE
jgi:plastocyanin